MQPLNPYLTVKDANAAIIFYQKAFGATETLRMPAQDGKRLMHAELAINGGTVMLSDEFPEYCEKGVPVMSPTAEQGSPVGMVLHFATPAEVDAQFKRATDAGCTGTMPPEDTFWDARFAALVDPFGHRWMFNAPLPAKS